MAKQTRRHRNEVQAEQFCRWVLRLACFFSGHRHPEHDHTRPVAGIIWSGESGRPRYVRCTRCGAGFAPSRRMVR